MAMPSATKMGWNAFGQQSLHVIDIRNALTYYSILARKTGRREDIRAWASNLLSAMDECYPLFKDKAKAEAVRKNMIELHAFSRIRGSNIEENAWLIRELGECNFRFMEGTQEEYLYSFKEKQTREQIVNKHLDIFGPEPNDGV